MQNFKAIKGNPDYEHLEIDADMDDNGNVIGEYHASLACYAIVRKLVEKYNADRLVDFTCCPNTINDVLAVVYDRCEVDLIVSY